VLAIMALHDSTAVQAILFFSLRRVTQNKIFLKILTKITIQCLCPLMGNNINPVGPLSVFRLQRKYHIFVTTI
jgi:hypothetical protein